MQWLRINYVSLCTWQNNSLVEDSGESFINNRFVEIGINFLIFYETLSFSVIFYHDIFIVFVIDLSKVIIEEDFVFSY